MKAQIRLACLYDEGIGVKKNSEQAFKWYKAAIDQNHSGACAYYHLKIAPYYQINNFLSTVNRAERTYTSKFQEAFERSIATTFLVDANAMFNLATCYEEGIGVNKNPYQALEWYEAAAKQDHTQARIKAGEFYEKGNGVDRNPNKAFQYYKAAAEQGDAEAQNKLGICYDEGIGVKKNPEEAFKWYQKAAKQGYAWAQNKLGYCYAQGNGIDKDLHKAFKWYKRVAEQKELAAHASRFHIGRMIGDLIQFDHQLPLNLEEKSSNLIRVIEEYRIRWELSIFTQRVAIRQEVMAAQSPEALSQLVDAEIEEEKKFKKLFGLADSLQHCLKIVEALSAQPGLMVKFSGDLTPFQYSRESESCAELTYYPELGGLACYGKEAVLIGNTLYSILEEKEHPNYLTFHKAQKIMESQIELPFKERERREQQLKTINNLIEQLINILHTSAPHYMEEIKHPNHLTLDQIQQIMERLQGHPKDSKFWKREFMNTSYDITKQIKSLLKTTEVPMLPYAPHRPLTLDQVRKIFEIRLEWAPKDKKAWEQQIKALTSIKEQILDLVHAFVPLRNQKLQEEYPWL